MSTVVTLRKRGRKAENDSSNDCSSETEIEFFKFPFMEVPADKPFVLGGYLSELLESDVRDETEIIQNLRILNVKPKLADFAQCVLKWISQGLLQSTPIRVGGIRLPLFHWVVLTGSHEVVDWLLNKGFDPFLGLPNTNWTPLHALALSLPWLCKMANWQKVRWQYTIEPIVEKLAHTLGAQDKDLATPIHIVAQRVGSGKQARRMYDQLLNVMVLSAKAEMLRGHKVLEKQDKDGNTMLHLLASKDSLPVKKAVSYLGEGAILEICNKDGEIPYDIAMRHGLEDLAEYLEPESETIEVSSNKGGQVRQPHGESTKPPTKKTRIHEPMSAEKSTSQKTKQIVNRRKSASSGPDYPLYGEKGKPQERESRVELDFLTPRMAADKAKAVVAQSERVASDSSGSGDSMDVSSVMEALVGSSVWEQLPGAAAQAKRKLQSDLEGYQKEITVISRAVESAQRKLDEKRRHLERLQQEVYSVREEVHQLEDQDHRYRERGHVLGDLLKEVLEKIRRLEKFVGGSDHSKLGRKDL